MAGKAKAKKAKIKFQRFVESSKGTRMLMFSKVTGDEVVASQCLTGFEFVLDGVTQAKAEQYGKSKEDWSDELDIIPQEYDGRVVGKVVRIK